jgi:hypothetical protein
MPIDWRKEGKTIMSIGYRNSSWIEEGRVAYRWPAEWLEEGQEESKGEWRTLEERRWNKSVFGTSAAKAIWATAGRRVFRLEELEQNKRGWRTERSGWRMGQLKNEGTADDSEVKRKLTWATLEAIV